MGTKIKLIEILNKIANGENPPRRIKYDFLEEGYKILIYDEVEQEYRFENDINNFLEIPNHHLNNEVEIIDDPSALSKLEITNWLKEQEGMVIWNDNLVEALHNLFKNYISKDKVKEKIKEYEESYCVKNTLNDDSKEYDKLVILVLDNLLNEEGKNE